MKEAMHALDSFPLVRGRSEPQFDMNPADHQHAFFLLHVACRFRQQPISRSRYLTRLQRARKGSGQSPGGARDDVIECRRVRLGDLGRHLVMLCDRAVHAE